MTAHRHALALSPREPELMPLSLMAEIWQAIGAVAEQQGYRTFFLEETGYGVVWFETDDGESDGTPS